MEDSPEQLTPTDQPRVRRRLVQSTLFPLPDLGGGERDSKRERKPRACSSNKVVVKSQETLNERIDDKDSSAKPNLLADPSEGQYSQPEQQCNGSQEENNGACSPLESTPDLKSPLKTKRRASSTPKKKQLQTTPRKKNKSGKKDTNSEQLLDCSPINGNAITVPDLRLEAKMKAEEITRMFSGRKIHPFFSSRKVEKKNSETIDVDNYCPSEKKTRSTNLGPIHVFEKVQDNTEPINWGNYLISKSSFSRADYDRQCKCSPLSKNSVDSLRFDDFVSLSLDPSFEEHRPASSPVLVTNDPAADCEIIMDMTMNGESQALEKTNFACGNSDTVRNSDSEWEDRFLDERMTTYYQGTDRHLENSLWTNKFLPEKASEVCGNCESVNFLSEWLRSWNEKGFSLRKHNNAAEKTLLQGDEYYCYGSDCDSENRDEANGLKNVLLVTGPVGSGKSAAIYACAKEQGFRVIEVNASDWRTRALVMQRFEGGMESYWVQRTVEAPMGPESKCIPANFVSMFNTKSVQGSDNEVTEIIPLSDEEEMQIFTKAPEKFVCDSNKVSSNQCENKPLILFEDVDAVLSEDHGLIATIQKLSETAKRPIILTSNSFNLLLPNNMDRHELCFIKPSVKELLSHAKRVCAAEKVNIHPQMVERFVGCCQGDIRKTILNLQFWCQGQKRRQDRKGQRKYGPPFNDIEAGHQILPKILPWGYPSELSKVLEREISQSLLAEETSKLIEAIEEKEQIQNEIQYSPNWGTPDNGSIKAKKEAKLKRHFPVQNGIIFSSPEVSNSTESPVTFTRRNVRRKLDTVLSSDSEGEEGVKDRIPLSKTNLLGIKNNDDILFQVDNTAPASKKDISGEAFIHLSEPLLNGKREGGNYCIQLPGDNNLENINDAKILFEADTVIPFCSRKSEMFSTPKSEQLIISKEDASERIFNLLSKPPLKGICERGLNDEICISGENLRENNEMYFRAASSAPSFCEAREMFSDPVSEKCFITKNENSMEIFNNCSESHRNGTSEGGINDREMFCDPVSEQRFTTKKEISVEIFNHLSESLCNGTNEGGLHDRVCLSEANFLENKNDDAVLLEAVCRPSLCEASLICSSPPSKQPAILKECFSKSSFNLLSEPPLKTYKEELNDHILISGVNSLENNNNDLFFQADSSALSFCEATEMCSDLAPEQLVSFKEEIHEESSNPLCQSVNMYCGPELSFVPETEINEGVLSRNDELTDPVDSTYRSLSKSEKSPQNVKILGVAIATPRVDEGDFNNEHVEDGQRGYQVMDECSRMEFNRKTNFKEKPRDFVLPESVEKMWKRLRNSRSDLSQYFTPEEREGLAVMKLACEMSNLISESDVLLGDCQPLLHDNLKPTMIPCEKSHSFSWYDDHMCMTSTIAEHGICFFTKEIASVKPDSSSIKITDLALEMLASSTSSMAMGNLVSHEREINSEMATPKNILSRKSDSDPNLLSVIQSIVPPRSYLATKGGSLYEYVSALGHFSRSETSRLSQINDRTRLRRVRVARNYLSTGAMMLSPDDISLLGQYSSYNKDS